MAEKEFDVIIVGAGVIGCSIARELSTSTDKDVLVLDKQAVASGATGLSAGLIAPTLFYSDTPDVAKYANEFFRDFDGTHGFTFTQRKRLDFVTEDGVEEARAKANTLANNGFPVSFLTSKDVEGLYEWFDMSGFAGAVEYGDTGWVDPYSYTVALKKDAESMGAEFRTGTEVTKIVGDKHVKGVETRSCSFESPRVVVAAGWRSPQVLDSVIPIRPYRTQCVVLEPTEPLRDGFPLGRVSSKGLYFRPEHNGDLLVGGGWHPEERPGRAGGKADGEFRNYVAETLPSVIRGTENARFINDWAGVDTATPDTKPIIDRIPNGPDGIVVATGFNGLGVMMSPIAGAVTRSLLTGGSPTFQTQIFKIGRFGSDLGDFEISNTSHI